MKTLVFIILIFSSIIYGQDSTSSSAFKKNSPSITYPLIKPKYYSYPLMTGYLLKQEAAKGDPFAQHELGLRYLIGRGFVTDTTEAVKWIKKASDQKLTVAQFNYGIMLINGIGTKWNPFEAYKKFKFAAENGMAEGQYMYGLLLTDNLVVNKNIAEAYRWIKLSAESDFEPAKKTLKVMEESNMVFSSDTTSDIFIDIDTDSLGLNQYSTTLMNSGIQLDYFEFSGDSSKPYEELFNEISKKNSSEMKKILGIKSMINEEILIDTTSKGLIKFAAESGSPEALMLEGKSCEVGFGTKKDSVKAALQYLRSLRLGSQRAAAFLIKLIQSESFFISLKKRIVADDPDAKYVWASLAALGFDYRLTNAQALELFESAAKDGHIYSLIELGLCYYSGNLVDMDRVKAIDFWRRAVELGSREAEIRIAFFRIQNLPNNINLPEDIALLKTSSNEGSVLATTALGYCYENGIGVKLSKAEASEMYRSAAQRGNETAYLSLKKLYDDLRPNEDEFTIID